MEALCRGVRKLSVTSTAIRNAEKDSVEAFATGSDAGTKDGGSSYHSAVQSSADVSMAHSAAPPADKAAVAESGDGSEHDEAQSNRVRVEWIAKSLTSIAPRYQAKSGECSVYSCLTQFTAPELLTGRKLCICFEHVLFVYFCEVWNAWEHSVV